MATTMAAPVTGYNMSNASVGPTTFRADRRLQLAYNIIVPAIVGVIMFAMGCDITIKTMKPHIVRPVGPIIGAVCQFIILPATAFGLAHAFGLAREQAIGMLIIACCPGGAVSNIITYFSNGDLSLSVCMTALSTILSLVMMPLNLFIYSRSWTDRNVQVPYGTIALTLLVVLIPVAIGIMFKQKFPKVARVMIKVGSVLGILLILVAGLIQSNLYPQVFDGSWQLWVAAFTLTPIGFTLGYVFTSIFCRPHQVRRTVGIETGVQNAGVALSIIALSFPDNVSFRYAVFPLLFAAAQMVWGVILVIAYRLYMRIQRRRGKLQEPEETETKEEEKAVESPVHGGPGFSGFMAPVLDGSPSGQGSGKVNAAFTQPDPIEITVVAKPAASGVTGSSGYVPAVMNGGIPAAKDETPPSSDCTKL